MKKIIKIMIIILIIAVLLFIINLTRNYIVINKLCNLQNNFDFGNNFFIKIDYKLEPATSTEIYVKDNTYLLKQIFNGEILEVDYHNFDTDELYVYERDSNGFLVGVESKNEINYNSALENVLFLKNYDNAKFELVKNNLFNIIAKENNCYKLKILNDIVIYINKDSGIVEKQVNLYHYDNEQKVKDNQVIYEIVLEKDKVVDDDINIQKAII